LTNKFHVLTVDKKSVDKLEGLVNVFHLSTKRLTDISFQSETILDDKVYQLRLQ